MLHTLLEVEWRVGVGGSSCYTCTHSRNNDMITFTCELMWKRSSASVWTQVQVCFFGLPVIVIDGHIWYRSELISGDADAVLLHMEL